MSIKQEREHLRKAFSACSELCGSWWHAHEYFERAFREAQQSERQHRRGAPRGVVSTYALSVDDCARGFVVRSFLSTDICKFQSYADICGLKTEVLYAKGARDIVCGDRKALGAYAKLVSIYRDLQNWDYTRYVTNEAVES